MSAFVIGFTLGWIGGYFIQPWWNRIVDQAFERWWP